ncbi:ATPase [Catellatospora sp. TT07R-123]|uniref:AAA family ATPase n=1 Tax=Catellatospora sp. TT07R-123 TaxID=2733863 RepID=UPI001B2EDD53|nr:AAA family ATPase [Catellatospora sp. TT07R-123]GHJ48952.1 ATPase [Catellatospora sp. TT07R-123]
MSDFTESKRDLDAYLTARVPVIGVRSIEQVRAIRLIREVAKAPKRSALPFWIYTRATGLRDLRTNSPVSEDRSLVGAMEYAALQFTNRAQSTLVFVDPEDLSDDNTASRHFAELARLADSNSGCIVLITDTPLWGGLQRLGMSLRLDLPDASEMYDVIVSFLGDHRQVVPIAWSENDARRAAEFLVGVPEGTAVNVMATLVAKGSIAKEDVESVSLFKDKHFGDLSGLERVVLKAADHQVGGLSTLRTWLARKHQLMVADLRDTALRPPRGVLLVGVPGCGKSLSAKAVAAQWNLPLYRLDLATILGQYVGQSENRLREALDTADRVAPCVLWIDEIEKGLAGQNDSTGVGRRLVGQFLFWLQESRSRVFVVATSNDVRSLPPELLRKGRFDEMFFVDLPDADDRREIIQLYYRRYVTGAPSADLLDKLIGLSEGFAGSDIEAALHDVGAEIHLNGGVDRLRPDFVVETFANTIPLSRTNPEQIDEIRAWGRDRAVPAGRAAAGTGPGPASGGRRVLVMGEQQP